MKTIESTLAVVKRYEIKSNGSIVYVVGNGEKKNVVTLNPNGSTGCYSSGTGEECMGHKYRYNSGHECKHVAFAQAEQWDREYEQWKREHGLDGPLSREAYVSEFDPDGIQEMLSGMAWIADRLHARLAQAAHEAEVA